MKSAKKQIAKSAVMLAFTGSLLAFGISSYAWFVNNQVSDGDGLSTKVDIDTDLVDIHFKLYKYDRDEKVGVEYVQGSDEFDLQLNDFDNFIRARNINNNNIIRFDVSFPNSAGSDSSSNRDISVSAQIKPTIAGSNFDGGFYDSVNRTCNDTEGYYYHNETSGFDYVCNNISNIIYFKGFIYSYTETNYEKTEDTVTADNFPEKNLKYYIKTVGDIYVLASQFQEGVTYYEEHKAESVKNKNVLETNPDTIYTTATDYFADLEEYTFINNNVKSPLLQLALEADIPANVSSMVFYVEYNYELNLIDSFLANTEMAAGKQDSQILRNRIEFMKDIESIKISSKEVK